MAKEKSVRTSLRNAKRKFVDLKPNKKLKVGKNTEDKVVKNTEVKVGKNIKVKNTRLMKNKEKNEDKKYIIATFIQIDLTRKEDSMMGKVLNDEKKKINFNCDKKLIKIFNKKSIKIGNKYKITNYRMKKNQLEFSKKTEFEFIEENQELKFKKIRKIHKNQIYKVLNVKGIIKSKERIIKKDGNFFQRLVIERLKGKDKIKINLWDKVDIKIKKKFEIKFYGLKIGYYYRMK